MNAPRAPRAVLLVEDEATNQLLMKSILDRIDLVPDIAATAEEALSALSTKSYDLVIMDVQLPGLSGIDATKQIRLKEKASRSHTLIIALTASEDPDMRKQCLDAGMDGYFAKPIKKQKFLDFLKHLWK